MADGNRTNVPEVVDVRERGKPRRRSNESRATHAIDYRRYRRESLRPLPTMREAQNNGWSRTLCGKDERQGGSAILQVATYAKERRKTGVQLKVQLASTLSPTPKKSARDNYNRRSASPKKGYLVTTPEKCQRRKSQSTEQDFLPVFPSFIHLILRRSHTTKNSSPAVPQPHETTKRLFRAAKQCGPPDEDDLCHCILRRHFESYLGRGELVQCCECKALSKPINIDWLVIPKEEREIQRRLQRKIGRARRIVEKKTNEEVKAKERARNTARLRRRRVKRKAERNTII
ncbi:hypothetical protein C8F04DRAFT_1179517 [Mycena alexandri]|uniref:Uncharacterized protein n=1 Tax=Mycena alexandri TaxID=1745969 RepID=A0AAD6X4A7_9AGAR|nr:hypothetical protein C8F04DRAFT_1179517 [Mycena alexandri]